MWKHEGLGTRPVEYDRQRDQGAVAALLLAATARGFVDPGGDALEVGIGQVKQGDGVGETREQRFGGTEQMTLQGA